jgi:hypothetical protein
MLPLKGGSALPKSRHISAKAKDVDKLQLDVTTSNKELGNPKGGAKAPKTAPHSAQKNNRAKRGGDRLKSSTPLGHAPMGAANPLGLSFDKYLLFNLYSIKHLEDNERAEEKYRPLSTFHQTEPAGRDSVTTQSRQMASTFQSSEPAAAGRNSMVLALGKTTHLKSDYSQNLVNDGFYKRN